MLVYNRQSEKESLGPSVCPSPPSPGRRKKHAQNTQIIRDCALIISKRLTRYPSSSRRMMARHTVHHKEGGRGGETAKRGFLFLGKEMEKVSIPQIGPSLFFHFFAQFYSIKKREKSSVDFGRFTWKASVQLHESLKIEREIKLSTKFGNQMLCHVFFSIEA